MSKFTLYITIALLINSTRAMAQDYYDKSKTVQLLKSKLKDPEGYYNEQKATIDQTKNLEDQLNAANQKNLELSAELDNKIRAIEELKLEANNNANKSNSRLSNSSNSFNVGSYSNSKNINIDMASPYRVQVGVFANYNMNGYLQVPKPFYSSNIDGRNVMEIGGFNSADEAYAFSQELRKLGVSGAFVTKYNGNQRDLSYDYLNHREPFRSTNSIPVSNYPTTPPAASSSPRNTSSIHTENNTKTDPTNNLAPEEPTSKPTELKRSGNLVIED